MNHELQQWFESPAFERWISEIGFKDVERAKSNVRSLGELAPTVAQFLQLTQLLRRSIVHVSDPDSSLNNLERFLATAPDSHRRLDSLVENSPLLFGLLTIFSDSQYFSELLRETENYKWLKLSVGKSITKAMLFDSIQMRMAGVKDLTVAMRELRQFKQREFLRIVYGDLVVGHQIEQVIEQISFVAAAVCDAAVHWCRERLAAKFGQPTLDSGQRCGFVLLGLGKLGGYELNYSSDIDLVAVFEGKGMTDGQVSKSNQEFFTQLTRDFLRLVGSATNGSPPFRVDFRLRPHGSKGAICQSFQSMIHYYDIEGRTWERQALIKANPVAGDVELGYRLLDELKPWIYRSSFNRSDIVGMKSIKRKIERRAKLEGEDRTNIKTGYGGIRDVEFVIQFMQLLNGWALPQLRTSNTLRAIRRLERNQCLTHDEALRLADNYRWLRKLEHRLQIMFNQQTHTLPSDESELAAIAIRMDCRPRGDQSGREVFDQQLREVTDVNRTILNHLLYGAFGPKQVIGAGSDQDDHVPPEVDLILEPDPSDEMIETVLSRFGFRDPRETFGLLMELASEKTKFLSSRRCKHFFAAIAPALLEEVSKTPDPDATLVSLCSVSDSLGAKGVLWELFSISPPTLNLYVMLCASCDYLATILKTNPGMVDELSDALQMQSLPSRERLEDSMREVSKGAVDIEPIVSSFKNTQHTRIGIRDILGQDTIREAHRTLSDVADICLEKVTQYQFELLIQKHGVSRKNSDQESLTINEGNGLSEAIPFAILGMGKLGGREPNYHSDLDVVFLYESDPSFESELLPGVSSQFFFSELAAGITQFISNTTQRARLYEIDSRLRPSGKSGSLAVSVNEFQRYFSEGTAQLWERQSLCKARVVLGSQPISEKIESIVRESLTVPWRNEMRQGIFKMRMLMEKDCRSLNLKRGQGGTVDIEFMVQMLQLQYGAKEHSILVPGTAEAIEALMSCDVLSDQDGEFLIESYQLLRLVESRLRLMNTTARHDLPEDETQLAKLAYLLDYADAQTLEAAVKECRKEVRQRFNEMFT